MADKFYGAPISAQIPLHVSEAGSTTGQPVELRVNDTVYASKFKVITALRAILSYLETKETSPIA
jgi:hypothetical protein